MKSILFIASILFIGCSNKSVKHNEKYYQTQLCEKLNGKMEYVLKDRTRVDCLTSEYAIEVDFAKKWAESVGQSLFYAQMTHKKPAVGLIVGSKDKRYLRRLNLLSKKYHIKLFILDK